MADSLVPCVESLRVTAVQPVHPFREILLLRPDDQVVVIRHQAVRVQRPVVSPGNTEELWPERRVIELVLEDRRSRDTARRDVEEAVSEHLAWDTWQPDDASCGPRAQLVGATRHVPGLSRDMSR